jgi:hypothetical protein
MAENQILPARERVTLELNEIENETPLFRSDCKECQFCDGLRDMPEPVAEPPVKVTSQSEGVV